MRLVGEDPAPEFDDLVRHSGTYTLTGIEGLEIQTFAFANGKTTSAYVLSETPTDSGGVRQLIVATPASWLSFDIEQRSGLTLWILTLCLDDAGTIASMLSGDFPAERGRWTINPLRFSLGDVEIRPEILEVRHGRPWILRFRHPHFLRRFTFTRSA